MTCSLAILVACNVGATPCRCHGAPGPLAPTCYWHSARARAGIMNVQTLSCRPVTGSEPELKCADARRNHCRLYPNDSDLWLTESVSCKSSFRDVKESAGLCVRESARACACARVCVCVYERTRFGAIKTQATDDLHVAGFL